MEWRKEEGGGLFSPVKTVRSRLSEMASVGNDNRAAPCYVYRIWPRSYYVRCEYVWPGGIINDNDHYTWRDPSTISLLRFTFLEPTRFIFTIMRVIWRVFPGSVASRSRTEVVRCTKPSRLPTRVYGTRFTGGRGGGFPLISLSSTYRCPSSDRSGLLSDRRVSSRNRDFKLGSAFRNGIFRRNNGPKPGRQIDAIYW